MKEGVESLADARLDDNKKDKLRESLNVFIKELPKESKTTVTEVNNDLTVMSLPKLLKKNKQFPAFSDAIEVKYEGERGRFGVASRDIRLGKKLVTFTNTLFICVQPILSVE